MNARQNRGRIPDEEETRKWQKIPFRIVQVSSQDEEYSVRELLSHTPRTNRSRGKYKNLISMKMYNVYKKDKNEYREISTNNNESMNNGISLNFMNLSNKNSDNVMKNPFLNYQKGLNYSFVDGKSTPHRISNNSFEYF